MTPPASLRAAWRILGWFGVALLIWLSLMPSPPKVADLAHLDKLEHLLAYALLMLWFAQLRPSIAQRAITAAALLALGIGLEFAQASSGVREFSIADMIADLAGITLGWFAAPPRGPDLLAVTHKLVSSQV